MNITNRLPNKPMKFLTMASNLCTNRYFCDMDKWKFTGVLWGLMCAALGLVPGLHAQVAQIDMDVLLFQTTSEPYLEVQLDIPGVLLPLETGDFGYRTVGEVTCILEQAGAITSFSKRRLVGPDFEDEEKALNGSHFHVDRLIAKPGPGRVTVEIRSEPGGPAAEAFLDVVVPNLDVPHFSSPMLVEAFGPAEPNSPYAHSGVDLLPVVGARVGFEAEELRYYMELYGVAHVPDSLIYIANWLEDSEGVELEGSRVYSREAKGQILPLFTTRPWGPTFQSARSIVWEAISKTGGALCREELPLSVHRIGGTGGELLPFVLEWTDRDSLLRHVQDHQPRANPSQQRLIRDVLPSADLPALQSFLDRFWRLERPDNPTLGHAEYVQDIAYVNERWGSCYAGHGADSDMGYVYLRYGKPKTVVQRHNETEYYPYEIWHYYRAGNFTDKRFLFYSPHMVAECFRLLHSDMLGEVSNQDWLTILRNRENNLRVTESQQNSSNPRDNYTREEPEDLFFNPR